MHRLTLSIIIALLTIFSSGLIAADFGTDLNKLKDDAIKTATPVTDKVNSVTPGDMEKAKEADEKAKVEYDNYKVSKGKECSNTVTGDKSSKNEEVKQASSSETHKTCSLTDKTCQVSASSDTKKAAKSKTITKKKTSKKSTTKK